MAGTGGVRYWWHALRYGAAAFCAYVGAMLPILLHLHSALLGKYYVRKRLDWYADHVSMLYHCSCSYYRTALVLLLHLVEYISTRYVCIIPVVCII